MAVVLRTEEKVAIKNQGRQLTSVAAGCRVLLALRHLPSVSEITFFYFLLGIKHLH